MAGLVPAISTRDALYSPKRDRRDKPGNDKLEYVAAYTFTRAMNLAKPASCCLITSLTA